MARVQGGEEPRSGAVDSEPIGIERGGQGLGAVAHVLVVLGLDFGALGELETNPLAGLWLAHWSVFFARFRGGPLDGPVLFRLAPWWKRQQNTWLSHTAQNALLRDSNKPDNNRCSWLLVISQPCK